MFCFLQECSTEIHYFSLNQPRWNPKIATDTMVVFLIPTVYVYEQRERPAVHTYG